MRASWRGRGSSQVPGWWALLRTTGLRQLQADVLLLDEADGRGEDGVAGEEDGLGVADAKGSAARDPGGQSGREVGESASSASYSSRGDEQRGVRCDAA